MEMNSMTAMGPTPRHLPATGLLVAAALSWGLSTVLSKLALGQLAPLDLLAIELMTGTAFVWLVLMARGGPASLRRWGRYALLGLLEPGLGFALANYGLARTGASQGALLLASESLFAIVLAWLVLGERLRGRVVIAVAVGFAGSLLIGLEPGGGMNTVLGDGLVLASSAAAGASAVLARRVASDHGTDALTVTAVQLLAAMVVAVPLVAAGAATGQSHLASADSSHLLAGVATGIAGSALPFLLYNVAIRDTPVTAAALILNLIPVFGAGLAVAILSERPSVPQLVGGALLVVAATGADETVP
jgi:drug/metabolite transporter (DMT)-like permease